MSNHFGLHCRTCKESSGHTFNHGLEIVQGLIAALPHLAAAYKADTSGYLQISYMSDYEDVVTFGMTHEGHELQPEDEYGRRYNDQT